MSLLIFLATWLGGNLLGFWFGHKMGWIRCKLDSFEAMDIAGVQDSDQVAVANALGEDGGNPFRSFIAAWRGRK